MNTPTSLERAPAKAERQTQQTPRLPYRIPFELHADAQCWVLTQIRLRQKRDLKALAAKTTVGYNTLWELEHHRHLNTALAPYAYAHALGYRPDQISRLTRRWLRKYLCRERRLHGKDRTWMPKMPWKQ